MKTQLILSAMMLCLSFQAQAAGLSGSVVGSSKAASTDLSKARVIPHEVKLKFTQETKQSYYDPVYKEEVISSKANYREFMDLLRDKGDNCPRKAVLEVERMLRPANNPHLVALINYLQSLGREPRLVAQLTDANYYKTHENYDVAYNNNKAHARFRIEMKDIDGNLGLYDLDMNVEDVRGDLCDLSDKTSSGGWMYLGSFAAEKFKADYIEPEFNDAKEMSELEDLFSSPSKFTKQANDGQVDELREQLKQNYHAAKSDKEKKEFARKVQELNKLFPPKNATYGSNPSNGTK